MKIRWREHEMVLVTMLAIILLAGYFWKVYNGDLLSPENPLTTHHVPFNFYRNSLFPDVGFGFLVYLSYLFISRFILSRSISFCDKNTGLKNISHFNANAGFRLAVWMLALILLVGTALNVVSYYKHEWLFVHTDQKINLPNGYLAVFLTCAVFAIYVFIREAIIYFIQKSGSRKAYFTLICNQVTAFSVIYITVPFFAAVFRLVHDGQLISAYFSLGVPVFLAYIVNTYWLFPLKKDQSFLAPYFLLRLLLSTFLCSVPFIFFPLHEGVGLAFLSFLLAQLFIVTPVTWLIYQLHKDKISQLRGVEEAFTKSKADLQFLRSQINPHFLFNVLNTIYSSALQENADRTAGIVQKLADMMRFMLSENTQEFIEMDQEIDYLKNYVTLQRLRIETSADVIIEEQIEERNCNHQIAPMLLIPFVENAFKHGIRLDQRSWIKIRLACTPREIRFEIRNSLHSKKAGDPEKESHGIGNINVLERLKLLYPGRHRVSVTAGDKEHIVQLVILTGK